MFNMKMSFLKWKNHLTCGLISALGGFLIGYTECLLHETLTVSPVFLWFNISYIIFLISIFFIAGLIVSILNSLFYVTNSSPDQQKTDAIFISGLFLIICLLYNNLQLNYIKEIYGNPESIIDNLIINLCILIFSCLVYYYLRRAKGEGQLIAFLAGIILLTILLTYLGPRFRGGALGSESTQTTKYNLFYLFFKIAYYYLLLTAIARILRQWFGYAVILFFLLLILIQNQVGLTYSLFLYAFLFVLMLIATIRERTFNAKLIFIALSSLIFFWFIHPFLLDSGFPYFPAQIHNKLTSERPLLLNYLLPPVYLVAFYLISRFIPKRETRSIGLLELRSIFSLIAIAPAIIMLFSVKRGYLYIEQNSRVTYASQNRLPEDTPNIILITLDTTRKDHLSVYGYKRKTTPELEKFAQKADLYTQAFSTAGETYPSHASIFTGTLPYVHGLHNQITHDKLRIVRSGNNFTLSPKNLTLAEILRDHGLATAAISAHPFLYQLNLTEGCDFVSTGIKHFNTVYSQLNLQFVPLFRKLFGRFFLELDSFPRANGVTYSVFDWLKKNKGCPFFLFINYFDPHTPYNPPKSYSNLFNNETLPVQYAYLPNNVKQNINLYDAEIVYMDKYLGLLFDDLTRMGLFDNSMIIIEGDHGESFGEHNYFGHGDWVYNDVIHIPLIIKYPYQKKGQVHTEPVSLVDIFPTVLNILNYPVPDNIQGLVLNDQSLSNSSREIISEGYEGLSDGVIFHRLGMLSSFRKIIEQAPDSTFLFDLAKDPYELDDISEQNSVTVKEMKCRLDSYLKSLDSLVITISEEELYIPKEIIKGLKAIGYIN